MSTSITATTVTNSSTKTTGRRNEFKFLGKVGEKLTPLFGTNKASGYAVIVLVMMFFYVGILFVKPILVTTGRQLRDTNIFYAKRLADRTGFASTSAIRNYITDQTHKRAQQQLIQHLALNRSSQATYTCQNSQVLTMENGGDLRGQFGLCDPTAILNGLDGDTNQTVDFLSFMYPKHNIALEDRYMDNLRKSLIDQYKNSYDYTLRSTYVGQERLVDTTTGERINRYRWMIRSDIETRTYFSIINHMVAYFDLIIDDKYYPLPFDGAGNNCDDLALPPNDEVITPDIVITQPDGSTVFCSGGNDCQPLGVKVTDGDPPTEHFYPFGSDQYEDACGTVLGQPDPYCGQGTSGGVNGNSNCGTSQGGDLQCDLGGGVTYVGYIKSNNIRPKRGCASINTGRPVARGQEPDPDGYTFTVTTRLVSFGSTFN